MSEIVRGPSTAPRQARLAQDDCLLNKKARRERRALFSKRNELTPRALRAPGTWPDSVSPTWKRVKRRMTMFSPSSAILLVSRSLIVLVLSFTNVCSSRQTVL